jgi:hypothetical protein
MTEESHNSFFYKMWLQQTSIKQGFYMMFDLRREREREEVDNTSESRLNAKWRKVSNCYSYLIPSLTGDISSISIPSFVCTETN